MGTKRIRQESKCEGKMQVNGIQKRRRGSAMVVGSVLSIVTCALLSRPTDAFASHRPSLLSSSAGTQSRLPRDGPLQYQIELNPPMELDHLKKNNHFSFDPSVDFERDDSTNSLATAKPLEYDTISLDLDRHQEFTLTEVNNPQSTSVIPEKATTASSFAATLQLWKRRLITKEDWKHMHKITGVIFLLSSWGLSGYAIRDMLAHGWTQPVTRHGRLFQVLLWTLIGSSVLQSFGSVDMACRHRRGQPAIRNTFLCNAAVAILGSVSALWSSAWYPACLNGTFSKAFYLIMDGIGLLGMADNLVHLKALIASRQTNKHAATSTTTTSLQYWKDVFVYMMPILIGAPFFVAIGWQFGIRHDRTFYLNLLQRPGHPHLQAGAVYGMVMVAMGASYSSLIVTLRDKKLIRKSTEGWSLTAVMLCLIGSLYQAMRDPGTVAMILGF